MIIGRVMSASFIMSKTGYSEVGYRAPTYVGKIVVSLKMLYVGRWTKLRGLWKLVYKEEYTTKTEALKREKFLKSGKGREFLKHIINGL